MDIQTFTALAMDPWATSTAQWSGEVTTAGRYAFVVVIDPENAIGARDTYRAEFSVE